MENYSKYEKARIIGARALQLSMGAPFAIKLSKEDLEKIHFNVVTIAKMEYEKDSIPLAVKRPESAKK